ncbi:MAG: SCP-like extracellular [Erythrobacter sp.]|nr:SCP-like extracellular [Erythrobacter sp.]
MKRRVAQFALISSAVASLFATGLGAAASAGERDAPVPARHARLETSARHTHSNGSIERRILASHNSERERLGLAPLKWNRNLEREADDWARELSRRGVLQHASSEVRNGTGENLWMGTAGVWNVDTMVGMFLDERRHYRHDQFPNISRTGNWADVGHYSQIVWRDTQEVGCAIHTDRGNDVLVCRYWPAGNVWGARAY